MPKKVFVPRRLLSGLLHLQGSAPLLDPNFKLAVVFRPKIKVWSLKRSLFFLIKNDDIMSLPVRLQDVPASSVFSRCLNLLTTDWKIGYIIWQIIHLVLDSQV